MAGRPKIPDILKEKRGTLVPSRVNEKQPVSIDITIDDLKPPTYLNKYAKSFFINYGRQLIEMGVLKRSDLMLLESLSLQVGIYVDSMVDIKNNGITYEQINRNGGVYKQQNPSVNIANNAYKNIVTGLSKFGLTPSDRSKISINIPTDDEEITLDNF